MKKIFLIIIIATLLVSVLGVYYLYESTNTLTIQAPNSGYLTTNTNFNESKIFLEKF